MRCWPGDPGIIPYLAVRFEWKFAVAGIVANLHDVVIILGFFAFFQWEFSLPVLAAVLAVLGYRERVGGDLRPGARDLPQAYRKMTTHARCHRPRHHQHDQPHHHHHGCTQMMVLSMLHVRRPTLFYFALALTIGILFGIYSSVFAAAIAMWLGVKREDLVRQTGRQPDGSERSQTPGPWCRVL